MSVVTNRQAYYVRIIVLLFSDLYNYIHDAAKTENNKSTVTVTATAPIAENRNMLFVILFRMRQYFMFIIIYTSSVISKTSGLSNLSLQYCLARCLLELLDL